MMTMSNAPDQTQFYLERMIHAHQTNTPLSECFSADEMRVLNGMVKKPPSASGDPSALHPFNVVVGGRGLDIFSQLVSERMILIDGGIDEQSAAIVCAALLFLETDASGKPDEPIKIHIMSPGGSVYNGLAIYDTIRAIRSPVETIGIGLQMSMGSLLLAAGDPGSRRILRNSTVMVHEASSGTQGRISTQEITLAEGKRLNKRLKDIYVEHTGLNHAFWDIALKYTDTYLTAEQARDLGIVDQIVENTRIQSVHAEFAQRAAPKGPKVPESTVDILAALHSDDWTERKAELIVALATKEEFMTPTRKAEEAWKLLQKKCPKLAADMLAEAGSSETEIELKQTVQQYNASNSQYEIIHPSIVPMPVDIMTNLAIQMYRNGQETSVANFYEHAKKGYKYLLEAYDKPELMGGIANDNGKTKLSPKKRNNASPEA